MNSVVTSACCYSLTLYREVFLVWLMFLLLLVLLQQNVDINAFHIDFHYPTNFDYPNTVCDQRGSELYLLRLRPRKYIYTFGCTNLIHHDKPLYNYYKYIYVLMNVEEKRQWVCCVCMHVCMYASSLCQSSLNSLNLVHTITQYVHTINSTSKVVS